MRSASHPYLDHDGPIAFAHRGGALNGLPENTMVSFRHAVEMGYRYIETDVQATADGVLLAFHDDDLSRTCDRPGLISALAWREVSSARVDSEHSIPLLTDLLEEFPDVRINIDCKTWAGVDPLVATLRRTNSLDRVCIGSFSDKRLRLLRRLLGDELCSSMGPGEVVQWLLGRTSPTAHAAQVPPKSRGLGVVTERTVRRAHRVGVKVHVWTIDESTEMHRLLDLGVDGLMTDRPSVLRDVMISRGATWPNVG